MKRFHRKSTVVKVAKVAPVTRLTKLTKVAAIAVLALVGMTHTAHAQPAGFGNAGFIGTLSSSNPRGVTLSRSGVAGHGGLYHTYRFTAPSRQVLDIRLSVARADVAVALFDGNGRFLKLGKPATPRITHTVNAGTYYVRTFATPNKRTSYRLTVQGRPVVLKVPRTNSVLAARTNRTNPVLTPRAIPRTRTNATPRRIPTNATPRRTPTPARPRVNPVRKISYGGLLYNDHSANSTLSPTTIGVGGTFRVTSSTMRFSGAGVRTLVALEDVNRRPGSFGVTRFGLRRFAANGNTITIAGPDLALFKNRSFRVVIVTYVNGRPTDYTMPGILRVR